VGGALSAHVTIDLGVAQGDTLSCTLYDIYVDDLTDAYDSAGAGVSLPACQPGGGTTDHRIHSFLFADDFLGVAESCSDLQRGVNAARSWCRKWRVQANIGPKKSAVMVFAPDKATQTPMDIVWGDEVVPQVTEYKYLGVVLSADCTWRAHVQYVLDKAEKTVHSLGSIQKISKRWSESRLVYCAVW
jgi:hypothetical protein